MSSPATESAGKVAPYAEPLDPKIWRVIAVVLLGPFMTQMDSTVVNVSLSSIRDALHTSITLAQWIVSGYLLALALMLPLNGWIVDRMGAKRLYVICFTAFTATSLFCGETKTVEMLIFARVLQGLAGGLLAPLTQMMLARAAGRHMARVMGYAATPILLAPTFGPIVAGAVLKYGGWPWLFYINLPVGILALILAAILLPADVALVERRPFDLIGFSLISPGLVLLLYGFERVSHGQGAMALISGLALLCAFVVYAQKRKSKALIDLGLFANPIFTVATITQFLTNGIMYAGQFLIPLYLVSGCGLSAERVGWMLAPMGVGMICIYPFIGYLTERFGCRALSVAGICLNVFGTLPFLWIVHHGFSAISITLCLLARGIGQGATGIPTIAAAYSSVPRSKLGNATTAINIVQRLGGPIATTTIAIAVSLSMGKTANPPSSHDFFVPFLVLIFIQLLVLVSAVRLPVRIHAQPA